VPNQFIDGSPEDGGHTVTFVVNDGTQPRYVYHGVTCADLLTGFVDRKMNMIELMHFARYCVGNILIEPPCAYSVLDDESAVDRHRWRDSDEPFYPACPAARKPHLPV
jgi:hypothetical protein